MDLQIYIDTNDIDVERLQEIRPLILKVISDWISEQKLKISLLSNAISDADQEHDLADENLACIFQ